MNYQYDIFLPVLRVLIVNPLVPESQLLATKIMSGQVFGRNQMIDLVLLVYSNELGAAHELRQELKSCAYSCYNSINVTSDLPTLDRVFEAWKVCQSVADADVFCFFTNLENPQNINYDDTTVSDQFDSLYLILKVASNLTRVATQIVDKDDKEGAKKNKQEPEKKPLKPIIIGDGFVVIDLLNTFTKELPPDIFFYNSHLSFLAKTIVSDYLKIQNNVLGDPLVWAANDEVFHLELEDPYIIEHKSKERGSACGWDSRVIFETFNLDYTQFGPCWLKRELVEKVAQMAAKNPYGCFNKAARMSRSLHQIWKVRCSEPGTKLNKSVGVISDGSLGTIKGLPYVLPLTFCGDSWIVNKQNEQESYLKSELKRINSTVRMQHEKLITYCKKFMEENVINMSFVPPVDADTDSAYTQLDQSSRFSTATVKNESAAQFAHLHYL